MKSLTHGVICFIICLCIKYSAAGPRSVLILLGDDVGLDLNVYNNSMIKMPNLDGLAKKGVTFQHGFTSVSSCSPSRSAILTGLPTHQNGMYGLHQLPDNFNTFENIKSLPVLLQPHNIRTGIVGKKHVGPADVYKFDYEVTEENGYNLDQIGRNITYMKEYVHKFMANTKPDEPFMLYIGIHDSHRSGGTSIGKYGQFMERFGDGTPGHGIIPDWKPVYYNPKDVPVPYFLQDTDTVRQELANMYTTMSRFDQGVGLFLKEIEDAGRLDDTLIIYTSDNGIPFPASKTNLYVSGMREPFIVSSPQHTQRWGQMSDALASELDILPTVLDWFGIPAGSSFTGKSLLPVLEKEPTTGYDYVYGSHTFHQIDMYYPMRVLLTKDYQLIHNLEYKMPYSVASDIFQSPSMQELLNRTAHGEPLGWYRTLKDYYYRSEWELYDVKADPEELHNLAEDPAYKTTLQQLQTQLGDWRKKTKDYWYCYPEGVEYNGRCASAYNET